MLIRFFKMQSMGNDYIYIDLDFNDREYILQNAPIISQKLSKRRFSVGSDGLVIIDSKIPKMIMYNADGTRGLMCGNALRCVGYYLKSIYNKDEFKIETDSGIKQVFIENQTVAADMGEAKKLNLIISKLYDIDICTYINSAKFYDFVNVGNNHIVLYFDDKNQDNGLIAPLLTKCKGCFDGINAHIIRNLNGKIIATVYERGSGETLSCGTGAAAIYYSLLSHNLAKSEGCDIYFKGGMASLYKKDKNIILKSRIEYCYKGEVCFD